MTAATLDQHRKIQARLQLQIMDVKQDISRLKAELKRNQDPTKMGKIQKQIGVSSFQVDMACRTRSKEAEMLC